MLSDDIRALLRSKEWEDGLTIKDIAILLNARHRSVYAAINGRHMPDAYIDRWDYDSAVWVCVPVPEHCPRPSKETLNDHYARGLGRAAQRQAN